MGGFRYNGCGVTDHFKKIKNLGMHICPNCRNLAEFTLDEARQKIDVFFIPTLTLKSRYAVMCGRCKQGEFCSVEWAGHLMSQGERPDVIFESGVKQKEQIPEGNSGSVSETKKLTEDSQKDKGKLDFVRCSSCGTLQVREGNFCAHCGKPVSKASEADAGSSGQAFGSENRSVCPSCGSVQQEGNKFCSKCGQKLAAEQIREKRCSQCGAKGTEEMSFCTECGAKMTWITMQM